MFALSARAQDFIARTQAFIQQEIEPVEKAFWDEVHRLNVDGDWTQWQWPEQLQQLKDKAKAAGLWNMFLPDAE
ncbi:MAG: acyl-CoA dehydrogenase, partial [Acinetobacter sp.]|nr:acyl-CoA dehydrogenase [Acinetobacter sp.]